MFPRKDPFTGRAITQRKSVVRRSALRQGTRNHQDSVFTLGIDLGQARDYTAIAIVEQLYLDSAIDMTAISEPSYHVRYLERLDLGTPYTEIVAHVESLMRTTILRDRIRLVVDRTGVGAPVADMFLHAGLNPAAVNIVGGFRPSSHGRTHNVPRQYLISVLKILLETGQLKIASALEFSPVLERELINFSARNARADDEHSISWRENEHDDLVFAMMLASYYFERMARPIVPLVRIGVR